MGLTAKYGRKFVSSASPSMMSVFLRRLFFLVLPEELFRDPEIPAGWGALVESNGALILARKPVWYETTEENRIRLLHRIAVRGTRALNRKLHDPGVFLQPR